MKEAKRTQITEQICKQIELMRKGGANQTEIGRLLGISGPTISRIEKAGFDHAKYLENKKEAREREKKAAIQPIKADRITGEPPAEKMHSWVDQIPGQVEMNLTETKPAEMSDQVKMMRFIASQADKLALKLDNINSTLHQLLRAVGSEKCG